MKHYQTYLRAELAKLGRLGDAKAFLRSGPCLVAVVPPPFTVERVVQAFASQQLVDDFVAALSPEALVALTDCCARWRGNNISADLSPQQVVGLIDAPVGQILLRDAEPRLASVFDRHGGRLTAIAADPLLLREPEYRDYTPGVSVAVPICLAKPDPEGSGYFRIIDGMHRAIQLVRNGQATIRICVVRDPA